jgi:hypothetical protein
MDGIHIALAVLIVLLLVYFFWYKGAEHFGANGDVIYLEQVTMKHPDPSWMHYAGREKDMTGMSAEAYYLENDILARNLVIPQTFEADDSYTSKDDYLGMPLQYRPNPNTKYPLTNIAMSAESQMAAGTILSGPIASSAMPIAAPANVMTITPVAAASSTNSASVARNAVTAKKMRKPGKGSDSTKPASLTAMQMKSTS